MERIRAKETKTLLFSFFDRTEWAEFELLFNIGNKVHKPVKFQAHMIWKTSGIPSMFSGTKFSYPSKEAAEADLIERVKDYGGSYHVATTALMARLEKEFGRPRT